MSYFDDNEDSIVYRGIPTHRKRPHMTLYPGGYSFDFSRTQRSHYKDKPMALSKTTHVTITGPARWARLYESNKDTKYGDASNVEIQLDNAALTTLKNVGWRGKIKEDNWAKFSRKHEQTYSDGPRKMGAPKVQKDGKPFDEMIGNGSILSLSLEVYPSKFGVGSRIDTVSVVEHVPYVREDISDGALPVD